MQSKSVSDALLSPLFEVVDPTSKLVIKTMPEDLWFGLRNTSATVLSVKNTSDYQDLIASMLNFPLKPSPLMIQDQASAAKQASEPNVQKTILNLLNTTATHVMRAVNSSLSALTIIDTTPLVEPSEAYGLCHDTVKDGVALNIGGNAADARLIPFWMCRFVNSDGKITSNLLTLMGDDAKQTAMFEQALCALGAEDLLTEINKAVTELKAQPMPDEVQGKIVLFPLGATAIKGDQYLSITPVPSAAMILKFKDRFFAEVNAQKAHSAEAKKNKQSGSHRVFNYPNSVNVNIVASNPANCGSTIQAISGTAKAFRAAIGSLSIEERLGDEGYLVRKLQSGRTSVLAINKFTLDYLGRTFKYGKVEKNWNGRLGDVLSSVIEPLQHLRQKGLPDGVDRQAVRFKFSVERRYAMREMGGDAGSRNLTPVDLHKLGQHVTERLQQALIRRDQSLGMNEDRQALVYETIVDLMR